MSRHWTEQALCATACAEGWADYADWFPENGVYSNPHRARRICSQCEVTAECLELVQQLPLYAQSYGIYGGSSARARRSARQRATA